MQEFDFPVESDIPVPKRMRAGSKYPFVKLEVGDSFFVPKESQRAKIVRNAADDYAKRHGVKFRVLQVEGGCRCWRVE